MEHRNEHGVPFEVHSDATTEESSMFTDPVFAEQYEQNKKYVRQALPWLALAVALLFGFLFWFARVAEAEEPELSKLPMWIDQGLMCKTEAQIRQVLDEYNNTDLPYPRGCSRVSSEVLATARTIGTHEAEGFVYNIARFTFGGYNIATPVGKEFHHFYDEDGLVLVIKYGWWGKTAIEGYKPATYIEGEDA